MSIDVAKFGFGIVGSTPLDVVRELAPLVEDAGFNTLWFNHTRLANAYRAMEVAAQVTTTLRLATGVTSVDSVMSTRDVIDNVRKLDLPVERLLIGIGASQPPSPLRTIANSITLLRDELPGVPVFVGALGPKMRAIGVREADGILLNWLTPAAASAAMADRLHHTTGTESRVALYVRCSLGQSAAEVMRAEADRYASLPSYAANFKRLGFSAMDAASCVNSGEELRQRLGLYQGVIEEPVIRAITANDTIADYASLIDAVRN